jgi:hypothetical protein
MLTEALHLSVHYTTLLHPLHSDNMAKLQCCDSSLL